MEPQCTPRHPRPSCHAVIAHEGKVLLVLRGHEPYAGWWGLPGGSVEAGETVVQALVREVAEETGLDVRPRALLGYRDAIARDDAGNLVYHFVIMFFAADVYGGTLRAASDAAAARWFDPAELHAYRLVPGVDEVLRWAGVWPPSSTISHPFMPDPS